MSSQEQGRRQIPALITRVSRYVGSPIRRWRHPEPNDGRVLGPEATLDVLHGFGAGALGLALATIPTPISPVSNTIGAALLLKSSANFFRGFMEAGEHMLVQDQDPTYKRR